MTELFEPLAPIGLQAHHPIPARESLARAQKILRYIEKKRQKVCCNLGYHVNGNENGVWLPGKYPVDGNGLDLWGSAETLLPHRETVGRRKVVRKKRKYVPLSGSKAGQAGAYASTNLMCL